MGRTGGARGLEVKFQGFLKVRESLLLGRALAGDIDFEALGHEPISFSPNGSGEGSLHSMIISQRTL